MVMSESKNLNQLPSEILQIIFEQLKYATNWRESTRMLYQCQLVCKGWVRSAQEALYTNVYLPPGSIAPFFATLVASPEIGVLVKNIEFYTDSKFEYSSLKNEFPKGVVNTLDAILQGCPNIESLGSPTSPDFESPFIWKRLEAVADNHFKRLKAFSASDAWTTEDKPQYTALAIRFKSSLTKLRLFPYHKSQEISKDADFLCLKGHLHEFTRLEYLKLCGSLVTGSLTTELNALIDECPQTTHSLELEDCKFSLNHTLTGNMCSNYSIEKLILNNPSLSVTSIQYLAKKLAALNTLVITTGVSDLIKEKQEYKQWWEEMKSLCASLQNYDISLYEFLPQTYLQQIKMCANLSTAVTKRLAKQNSNLLTEFILHMRDPESKKSEDFIIEMKRNNSRIRLFGIKHTKEFLEKASLQEIVKCIQPYSFDVIRFLNTQHLLESDSILQSFDFTLNDELEYFFRKKFGDRSWAIFSNVRSMANNKTGTTVHLDKMVFPNCPSQEDDEQTKYTSIAELIFTKSLFYPNVFSGMTSKLPEVDTLILDGCTFISSSSLQVYQIEIDLNETKLGHLELNMSRVLHSHLLLNPGGYHTIVVTTGTGNTKNYKYMNSIDCETYQETEYTAGFANDSLIFIKCKELESLAVSGVKVF
ncbi:hypothetical protein BD408DRAFT_425072 [Parasitella parasitica]|nr:hypothetical protein BD408DRAFT_425072 [Parasitella parasitica]